MSQHKALDVLNVDLTSKRINWVLDADVKGFFGNVDHQWLIKFLEHRIGDKRILRLIRKWLRAGVSDEGKWSETTVGAPQGAVASPLLANVYLHYVLDLWIQWWRENRCRGDKVIVRRATLAGRKRATLAAIKRELIRRRHRPLGETGRWLRRVLQSWLGYTMRCRAICVAYSNFA
jgi:retron-type reverse transcriptase